ncbi:type VI secretion system protein TssA [Luteibacter sp.]|jgi:type VI secretion system protein ImpA|uniref:type VI secretion system protein TssA n=1 Tax=Luteibacter sp. TaxID=1886636 RepID=UPI002F4046B8
MDDLLHPIAGDLPAGEDLTFSAEFDTIAEARRHDDPTIAQGEWTRDLKTADWPRVLRLCEALLGSRTKDLRVAGWYTEAHTQANGFSGLAAGYTLTHALCRDFWATLHPADDDEERAGALRWLIVQSAGWIRRIPLGDTYTLDDLSVRQGGRPEAIAERRGVWREAMPAQHQELLTREVEAALAALDALDAQMQTHLGDDAPSASAAGAALVEALDLLRVERSADKPQSAQPVPARAFEQATMKKAVTAITGENHRLQSREEALQALRAVARFFRDTEPHSPVAYLADKAARWGEMPLHIWLHAVLGEGDALSQLNQLLDADKRPDAP